MKRTYVDIIGEYYDNQSELADQANALGLSEADFRGVFKYKVTRRKKGFFEE